MYPDPITPRAHPELLAALDYDPFHVMPAALPPAPRAFAPTVQIQCARERLAAGSPIDRNCYDRLIALCELDKPLPELGPATDHPDWGGPMVPWLNAAFHNALAWRLNDDPRHRERALEALRRAAQVCATIGKWTGHEHHEATGAARAYDLLAGPDLTPDDDATFRTMLETLVLAMDRAGHRQCNNHNSMQMVGRLVLAAALGNRQYIHDVLYGCNRGGDGWRYGLIHLLRHDFLADGMDWEGVPGYHMLVMMMVCECFTIMENLGVDLWRRTWPALRQDDGYDEHRGWGPKGEKSLTAAADALIYQAFTNGDYSQLHDQVLGNLRATHCWWPLFNKLYAVYGEPRYAWALQHSNGGTPATVTGPVPPWFSGAYGPAEFVRVETREYPAGENPFGRDRAFSLTGRHVAGCSLFPMHGSAVLRSDADDTAAPGAYLYWGPHWAGHRSPAALHLDIHAFGRRLTTAPHLYKGGYDEPRHLTWFRTTVAHNTVAVDEQSMFPYDFPTQSLWECDHWRDTLSDGHLEQFQPEAAFKAVRASNDDVYTGVRLDRTVVLTREYVLDVYRVSAAQPRLLDWAMHVQASLADSGNCEPLDLGQNRGYQHFMNARRHPQRGGWVALPFTLDTGSGRALVWLDGAPDARLLLAQDPELDERTPMGDLVKPQPRTCVLVRTRASSALFVSLWSFAPAAVEPLAVQGAAGTDVAVALQSNSRRQHWLLPFQGPVTLTC